MSDSVKTTVRADGRALDELRPVTITRGWLDHAEGSCLIECGRTRVLVAASVTEGVPRWRRGSGLGWVTSEYEHDGSRASGGAVFRRLRDLADGVVVR